MLSYITQGVYKPWSSYDIAKFESEGSQRDSIIYNSAYNSRIMLTEKNIYQCSIKQNSDKYQNFYLFAVTRNLFYFIMYIPQMEAYRDSEVRNDKVVTAALPKLAVTRNCIFSFDGSIQVDDNVSISDGTSFFIKVEANIGEFLFPKYKNITNSEILRKYSLMNQYYKRAIKENEVLINALDKFDKRRKEILQKKLIKMVVRKGIRWGVPAIVGLPGLGALLDLDSLFGLGDVADLADMASNIPISDLINIPDDLIV